jgi:hypothetical protein
MRPPEYWRVVTSTVDLARPAGQGPDVTVFVPGAGCRLNRPVTHAIPDTSYGLAPALAARLVGRSLVTLAVLVAVATAAGLVTGVGWVPAGVVTVLGLLLVGGWAWWLLRRAWTLRLTGEGYAVRLLGGIGAAGAAWTEVGEVTAASPGGEPCLVVRLADGRTTRLPMAALAADPDVVALDVRRRLRDAHSSGPVSFHEGEG